MDKRHAGQVSIVTGGARGIGRAIAQRFDCGGAQVIVADIDERGGRETAAQLENGLFVPLDVTDRTSVAQLVETMLDRFGRIDVLVNNAGVFQNEPTLGLAEATWDHVLDVDLKGTFLCSQAVGRVMIAQQAGCLINISSINGLVAFPERLAYNVAKAGVVALTKALAAEWAPYNITVNSVAPGYVYTEATAEHLQSSWFDGNSILKRTPLGRWIDMRDIAHAVSYLASAEAANLTGVVLPVDGGWVAYGYL